MSQTRYLTKSKFKLAMECPTKLFYNGKKEYANRKLEDTFLAALADGGFQVGELAKCYFPGGLQIFTKGHEDAVRETNELLERENVIIFEAAFRRDLFFIRADIVIKREMELELIEVKAKSCDFADESGFLNKNGTISGKWIPYIEDVAFQKYVVRKAFPELNVKAFLMLADKTAHCPTDGLNQKFRLVKDADGRKSVAVSQDLSLDDLSTPMLRIINVDESCENVYAAKDKDDGLTFEEKITMFADRHAQDEKIVSQPSTVCKNCEFQIAKDETDTELKSGFRECWTHSLNWRDADFDEPNVLDIWNYGKKDKLINDGKIKLSSVSIDDIAPKEDTRPGLSNSERQWLQIEKARNADKTAWLDRENLKREMNKWTFPLHFIDFETSSPVVPFKKGRRPYEGIAFQFSHHTVDENGTVKHRGEYLNAVPGTFPNYDFVRELKAQLESDPGSIFRYHNHENSYLNTVYNQLNADSADIPDRRELCEFIKTITRSTKDSVEQWEGGRNMIDLCELVKRHYYDPATNGSNSIKYILPAILNSSAFLRDKYSAPVYGAADGIRSLNFTDHKWVELDGEKVRDPYRLLPKLFTDESDHDYEILISDMDELRDGGAALTAYGKLQFQEMSEYERSQIQSALLKYCELDTLAMVMIYEAWKAEI